MRLRRPDLRVESFEYVEVAPGLALLRLAGEWRGEAPGSVRLFGAGEELAALPEPPPSDGDFLWRAAFSASAEALDGPLVLETDDHRSVDLPLPVPAALRGAGEPLEPEALGDPEPEFAEPVAEAPPDPEPLSELEPDPFFDAQPEPLAEAPPAAAPPEPEPLAGASSDLSLLEALATAEHALQAERERHERAEAALREQLRAMVAETADFMGRLEGYELRRAELEKELSWERLLHKETRRLKEAADAERDEAVARLGPAEEELVRTRHEVEASARAQRKLAEARERIEELERRLEHQEDLIAGARAVADRGGERLAELEQRIAQLRDAAAGIHAERDGQAIVPSTEQAEAVERAIEEADRGTERLAQIERRVGELREGIAQQPAPTRPEASRRRFRR